MNLRKSFLILNGLLIFNHLIKGVLIGTPWIGLLIWSLPLMIFEYKAYTNPTAKVYQVFGFIILIYFMSSCLVVFGLPNPGLLNWLELLLIVSLFFVSLIIFSSIQHLILPSVTLGILLSGIFSRALRLNLEEVLKKDYIEAAKSRGINNSRVLVKHALPNTLLPILTITGLTVSSLVGGALLIEITFSWPGIALGLQEAINQRDYPVVQGIVVVISSLVVMISVCIDIAIAYIDPRVSY